MADEDYSGEPLTPKNIKTINSLPHMDQADIDPADVILVQDVSANEYKKATLRTAVDTVASPVRTTPQTLTAGEKSQARDNIGLSIQSIFDICHPIGEIYVQFPSIPDMDGVQRNTVDPMTLYNVNGITSTWVELNFDGAFFRANGGLAENFGSQGTSQPYATGKHSHTISYSSNTSFDHYAGGDWGFLWSYGNTFKDSYFPCSSELYPSTIDDSENRPVNYTVKIWLRTA